MLGRMPVVIHSSGKLPDFCYVTSLSLFKVLHLIHRKFSLKIRVGGCVCFKHVWVLEKTVCSFTGAWSLLRIGHLVKWLLAVCASRSALSLLCILGSYSSASYIYLHLEKKNHQALYYYFQCKFKSSNCLWWYHRCVRLFS